MKTSFLSSSVFKAVLLLVIAFMAYNMVRMQLDINLRKNENEVLSQSLSNQIKNNEESKALLESDDYDFAQKIAREKLGYGALGEIIYNVIGQ